MYQYVPSVFNRRQVWGSSRPLQNLQIVSHEKFCIVCRMGCSTTLFHNPASFFGIQMQTPMFSSVLCTVLVLGCLPHFFTCFWFINLADSVGFAEAKRLNLRVLTWKMGGRPLPCLSKLFPFCRTL